MYVFIALSVYRVQFSVAQQLDTLGCSSSGWAHLFHCADHMGRSNNLHEARHTENIDCFSISVNISYT